MVSPEGQYPVPHGNAGELSNKAISGQSIRHRTKIQRHAGQERQLLDKTQITGAKDELTNHKITNYRADDSGATRHSETMRRLSTCSRDIEQASQRIGNIGDTSGSAFDRARKAAIEAIERISGYLEEIALKLKQAVFTSKTSQDQPGQNLLPPDDDMGMG